LFSRRERASDAATSFLGRQARGARDLIGPFSADAVASLQEEAALLPESYDLFAESLLSANGVAADLRDVRRMIGRGAPDAAVRRADTPEARVAVALTLVALRESGEIDEHLAAAALLELVNGRSPLTEAALVRAAAKAEIPSIAASA
jgi:hypothetical protein